MATVFFESTSELAKLTNTFKVGITPTDPTTISLTITTPAQVSTTYTYAASQITKSSTGVYTKDIACSEAGTWTFEWVGTGAAADVEVGTWEVFPTSLGRLYAPLETLKSRLGISDADDDFELHGACFAASRSVEQYCERVFYRSQSEARTFVPRGYYCLKLPEFNDLVSVSSLKTDATGDGTFEVTWSSTDYQLLPNATSGPETKPYAQVKAVGTRTFPVPATVLARSDLVEITGVWGWPSVPYMVREATLILAADYWKLKDAPFGVAGFGDFGPMRVRDNHRVAALLDPYRRNRMLMR